MSSLNKRKREDDKLYRRTRKQAIERDSIDGYPRCVLCGCNRPSEVHHIVSRGQCGTSELTNLATLCNHCHHEVAHGVDSRRVKKILLKIVKERTDKYEKNRSC